MGIIMPETCWVASMRLSNKFYNWLLHLVGRFIWILAWHVTLPFWRFLIGFKKKDSSVLRTSLMFKVSPYTVHTGFRNISVRIATRWWMDVPRFEPWCGRCFPYRSRVPPRPIQPPVQCDTHLFPLGKTAGAWRWPPHSHPTQRLKK
jgi:hypothetical protein